MSTDRELRQRESEVERLARETPYVAVDVPPDYDGRCTECKAKDIECTGACEVVHMTGPEANLQEPGREPLNLIAPRDEQIRRIIADCLRRLRAIGEEELARQIQTLPRVREAFDDAA